MSATDATDPQLDAVAWDLSHLLDGGAQDPAATVDAMLAEGQRQADAFAEAHAGRIAELDGAGLVSAMRALADLQEVRGRGAADVDVAVVLHTSLANSMRG